MKPAKKNGIRSLFFLPCLLLSLALACPGASAPAKRFTLTAAANLFASPSAAYREIYGSAAVMPEIKAAFSFRRGLAVWGSCGYFTDKGTIMEVDEKAAFRRILLGLGVSYALELNSRLRLRGELGLAFVSYRESALATLLKGSALGGRAGAGLDYSLGRSWFVTLAAACLLVGDDAPTGKIKLGGFQAGAGLGFAF